MLKIPGSREQKARIKTFLKIIPDTLYIKMLYRMHFGKKLDLNNPRTFNEKIQWLKIHDRNPRYTDLVDKYEVKKYVSDIIGEEYIVPVYGIWESFDEIDFNAIPDQFVLKCTHDSGSAIIIRDKNTFDYETTRKILNKSLRHNFYYDTREWPYKNIEPRIIIEKLLENDDCLNSTDNTQGIIDYKFFCFSGEPKLLYISKGLEDHSKAAISFYDLEGNELYFRRKDYKAFHNAVLPDNFPDMIGISRKLAQHIGSAFLRVDLYSIRGRIYFSEVTFFPCGGLLPFDPESADLELGSLINLSL